MVELLKWYPDSWIINGYKKASLIFGDICSYLYMGECVGFRWYFRKWKKYEKEYAKRGYRTIPIDDLIDGGGYGKNITNLFEVQRSEGEEIVLHSELYEREYLGRVEPVLNINAVLGGQPQFKTYSLPTTKEKK